MADRVCIEPAVFVWLEVVLGGTGGQHPRLGWVRVIDVEVQV